MAPIMPQSAQLGHVEPGSLNAGDVSPLWYAEDMICLPPGFAGYNICDSIQKSNV